MDSYSRDSARALPVILTFFLCAAVFAGTFFALLHFVGLPQSARAQEAGEEALSPEKAMPPAEEISGESMMIATPEPQEPVQEPPEEETPEPEGVPVPVLGTLIETREDTVNFSFIGDILFDGNYATGSTMSARGGFANCLDAGTRELMQSADVLVANNEFTYTNTTEAFPELLEDDFASLQAGRSELDFVVFDENGERQATKVYWLVQTMETYSVDGSGHIALDSRKEVKREGTPNEEYESSTAINDLARLPMSDATRIDKLNELAGKMKQTLGEQKYADGAGYNVMSAIGEIFASNPDAFFQWIYKNRDSNGLIVEHLQKSITYSYLSKTVLDEAISQMTDKAAQKYIKDLTAGWQPE